MKYFFTRLVQKAFYAKLNTSKSIFVFSFLFVSPFFSSYCFAKDPVYRIEGARGVVTFTSRKPSPGTKYSLMEGNISRYRSGYGYRYSASTSRYYARPQLSRFDSMIYRFAGQYNLEPALVKAVVHAESSFRPDAVSPKGAMGLMQLMPQTAKRFGVTNAFQPEQNVLGGVKYLRFLMNRYYGNMELAVAAYNAGEGAVDRAGGIPPYKETINYVDRVTRLTDAYRCQERGGRNCSV
jgi:membrane-bound lytic murein transglycosylase MltF